jgi:type I restriction enzyme M protein
MLTRTHTAKARIATLWSKFHRAGMSNALEVVEQISYLTLLRFLDLQDRLEAARGKGKKHVSAFAQAQEFRWSQLIKADPKDMIEKVRDKAFPMIKDPNVVGETIASATKDAVFTILKPELLASTVKVIEDLNLGDPGDETQAEVYEEILTSASVFGRTSQFITPRHIIRTVVEVADPKLGESICDPAAGTGGFLIGAYRWLRKAHTPRRSLRVGPDGAWHNLTGKLLGDDGRKWAQLEGDLFTGYDGDATMVRIGLVNMLLHAIRRPRLHAQDTLSKSFNPLPQKFDLVFATPPFVSNVERSDVNREVLKLANKNTDLLYIEMCLALLKRGGRCAVIVPDEVLFGSSAAHKQLRQYLVEQNRLNAVVCLPPGAFKPSSAIKTVVLFITKGGVTKKVWFYEVTADGHTLDDSRKFDPRGDNNLSYVPQWYRIKVEKKNEKWASKQAEEVSANQSWYVEHKKIAEHNFSLAPGAYRPVSEEDHRGKDPMQIIENLRSLEEQIKQKLDSIAEKCKGAANA